MILAISVIGAGWSSFVDYLDVARTTAPSTASLSGLTGIGWLSEATLVGGALLALVLGRWPRWSFTVAVVVSIIGTPSLYLSGWVALLAVLAPFSDGPSVGRVAGPEEEVEPGIDRRAALLGRTEGG